MANIVITHDTNFLYIDYGTIENYCKARTIRKSSWAALDCLADGEGVQVEISGGDSVLLMVAQIDSIDSITTMTTDAHVYSEMKKLM